MKFNNKLIFLIACMIIFLLVGAISATKKNNENISNVDMKDNTLGITSVNQNNSVNQSNNLSEKNLNSTINNESEINNTFLGADESFDDLQKTINSLPDNSVLNLDCDYIYNGTGNFNGIIINKTNFIINGHGHTLDANSVNNIVRIFNVTGSKVTLKNLVLRNANVKTKDGGAILNTGQSLTINNTIFSHNKAHYGGAIQNSGTQVTITKCVFTNNQVSSCGGAINNNADKFSIYNSRFSHNTAHYGGAICNNHANFTLNNSNFTNNQANNYGGAIQNNNGGTDFTITNSNFNNNQANSCGGAINNNDNKFSIKNSNFNNDTSSYGGAICTDGKSFTLDNSRLTNNIASQKGGAIQNNHAINTTIKNSVFTNNNANIFGGAIHNDGSAAGLSVDNSTFIKNNANDEGGAIYNWKGKDFSVGNSIFVNNTAKNVGGAIRNHKGVGFNIDKTTFTNNTAGDEGGAIWNNGNYFTINKSTFNHNKAEFTGGAIHNKDGDFKVVNSIFIYNQVILATSPSGSYGGAIYSKYGDLSVDNSTFIYNMAISFRSIGSGTYGGAIYSYYDDGLSVYNSTFNHNIAGWQSAIGINPTIFKFKYNCNIAKCSFINNTALYGITVGIDHILVKCVCNDNWWGTNTPNWDDLFWGKVIHDSYAVLNLKATNKTIEVNFYKKGTTNVLPISRDVTLSIGDKKFTGKIVNGTFKMNYTPPIGKYTVTASVDNQKLSTNLKNKINVNLDVHDVNMYYHDGTRLVAKLTDLKNNPIPNAIIYFNLNNRIYNRTTDANGTASMDLNLESNKYPVRVSYNGSDAYSEVSKNITINVNTTLIGKDIIKTYQDDTQFYATFLDSHGTPLGDTNVTFNINGVYYTRQTNASGVAKLTINLQPGKYTLTAYNPVTNEQKGFKVIVLPKASDSSMNNSNPFNWGFFIPNYFTNLNNLSIENYAN